MQVVPTRLRTSQIFRFCSLNLPKHAALLVIPFTKHMVTVIQAWRQKFKISVSILTDVEKKQPQPRKTTYLKRAFSAPKICTVEAGYLARLVRLPAWAIKRAATCKTSIDTTLR